MANHVRLQIRDAIVAAVTGLPTTGANVYTSVVYPLEEATLPGLIVRIGAEQSSAKDMQSPTALRRDCDMSIIACAEDNGDIDAALSAIAAEIEAAIEVPTPGAPWKFLRLTGSTPRLDGSSEKVRGQLALTYRATYYTMEDDPTVPV
jgi:hypothetical protein